MKLLGLRAFLGNLCRSFRTVYFDAEAEKSFRKPLVWLKLGGFLCFFNGMLTAATFCLYCLIPGHSLETYTPIFESKSDWAGLVIAGYVLIGLFLFYLKRQLETERYDGSTNSLEESHSGMIADSSREVASDLKIAEPRVLVTDASNRPLVECVGYSATRPTIVVQKDYIGIFDKNELDAVLAHELYHFAHDSDFLLYTKFFLKGVNAFRTTPLFFIGALSLLQGPLLLFFLPGSAMGDHVVLWWILYVSTALLQVVGIFAGILFSVNSLNILNDFSYVDVFHLEADVFAALATKKPFMLATAELKTEAFQKFKHPVSTAEAAKAVRGSFNMPPSEFGKELRVRLFSNPETGTKIRGLLLVDALLFGEVGFKLRKQFKIGNVDGGIFTHSSPFKNRVLKIDEREIASIYGILLESRENLNLTQLHGQHGISIENTLALFMFLIIQNYIELTNIKLYENRP